MCLGPEFLSHCLLQQLFKRAWNFHLADTESGTPSRPSLSPRWGLPRCQCPGKLTEWFSHGFCVPIFLSKCRVVQTPSFAKSPQVRDYDQTFASSPRSRGNRGSVGRNLEIFRRSGEHEIVGLRSFLKISLSKSFVCRIEGRMSKYWGLKF